MGGSGLYRSLFGPQRLDFGYIRYSRARTGVLRSLPATFSVNRQQDDRLEQPRPTDLIERQRGRVAAFGYTGQGLALVAGRHVVSFGGEVYDEYIASARVFEHPVSGAATGSGVDAPGRNVQFKTRDRF